MSTTYTWEQVVSAITGVVNRGGYSKTFTPTTSYQSASSAAGYYSSVSVACNAVSLSGNAGTGQVLSGYTFYSNSLTRQTGTMANRGNLNWSGSNTTYSVPAGYYSGGTLDSRTSYNNGYNSGVNAGRNTGITINSLSYCYTSNAGGNNKGETRNFSVPSAGNYMVIIVSNGTNNAANKSSSVNVNNGTVRSNVAYWLATDSSSASTSQINCRVHWRVVTATMNSGGSFSMYGVTNYNPTVLWVVFRMS